MERTISFMMHKGSIRHNIRSFKADNVDPTRTCENVIIKNISIKQAYHDLFDEALDEYNAKQKRQDRKITDYYEHIRTSKQSKLFHEIIVQVGNMDDSSATGEYAELMKEILYEYALDFEKRNPNLYVICSVIHMDEQTPHLHIDYIPVSHNNKRGLKTQNSLKGALKELGFVGEARGDTEWKKFAESEKEMLAIGLYVRNIDWHQKGSHEEHLSVLDYKKKERAKEVKLLELQKEDLEYDLRDGRSKITELEQDKDELERELGKSAEVLAIVQAQTDRVKAERNQVIEEKKSVKDEIARMYAAYESKASEERKIFEEVHWQYQSIDYMDRWQPPEPEVMSAKKYRETQVNPFWETVKKGIKGFVQRIKDLKAEVKDLMKQIGILKDEKAALERQLSEVKRDLKFEKQHSEGLEEQAYKMDLLEQFYDPKQIQDLVDRAEQEKAKIRVRRR